MTGMSARDRRCVSWQSDANEDRVSVGSKLRDPLSGASGWWGTRHWSATGSRARRACAATGVA
jgi:hypothetical protein